MKTTKFSLFLSFLFITLLAVTSCKKEDSADSAIALKPDTTTVFSPDFPEIAFELPFENSNLKMEIISSTIPGGSSNAVSVTDMHFFNESTGLIITYTGRVYKTSDKGLTWSLRYSNPGNQQPLNQILFIDQNLGYIVGGEDSSAPGRASGGVILKTTDGGETWTSVFQITGLIQCNSIAANTNGDIYVTATSFSYDKDKIFRSIDGGITWSTLNYDNFQLSHIIFIADVGFCTGGFKRSEKIYRSSDNGNTWSKLTNPIFRDTYWTHDIVYKDSIGFCIGNDQSVYKTTDFGENWTLVHSGTSYKADLLTSNSCIIWGAGGWYGGDFGYPTGAVRLTTNGGKDWTVHYFKRDVKALRYSSFYSPTEGYVTSGIYLIKVTVK
jgi:photosystem II stability/assembly factor-like uncharacterized protein